VELQNGSLVTLRHGFPTYIVRDKHYNPIVTLKKGDCGVVVFMLPDKIRVLVYIQQIACVIPIGVLQRLVVAGD
jgi:hypothetical protein